MQDDGGMPDQLWFRLLLAVGVAFAMFMLVIAIPITLVNLAFRKLTNR